MVNPSTTTHARTHAREHPVTNESDTQATDAETLSEESRQRLLPEIMAAGAKAPLVLAQRVIEREGLRAEEYATGAQQKWPEESLEDVVHRVTRSHVILARSEGAVAGAAMSGAEAWAAITGGTATPAAVATFVGDLLGLAYIQARMVLIIGALHGHDPNDFTRYKEFLTISGLWGPETAAPVSEAASKGAQRILTRLLKRYLKGEPLKAATSLFRAVGIRFSRAGLIRIVPLINIPINAAMNDVATRAIARKAHAYYGDLPPRLECPTT